MSKTIPWRSWLLLAALSLVLFTITASTFSSLGVVLPAMIKELKWSFGWAFFGFTLLGAFCGASSWLPAILVRKVGVRGTIVAGSAVMVAGFACLAAAHGLAVYLVGTALLGVGYQMMALIPGTHVLSMLFRKRALPFGIYFTIGSLGGVAGPWMALTGMEMAHGGWRPYWWAQAIASVVVGALCAALVGGRAWLAAAAVDTDKAVAEAAKTAPADARVYRTTSDWTVREALATPQFWVILAAYFAHLLGGVTAVSLAPTHFSEIGVASAVAVTAISLESLMQVAARLGGGLIGDRVDPRWLLAGAQGMMAVGLLALTHATTWPVMMLFAVGVGVGFGLTVLAVSILLLNYYGRKNNLEIFSLVCLAGAVSALGPVIGGLMRDRLGGFAPTFQLFAAVIGVIFLAALFMRPPRKAVLQDPVAEPIPDMLQDAA
ncbi:CynX/NimT family MFS transporter [Caulobacter sp. UNC279MFTsu5.1]|uniref:MFS transporter n=1 Tax=Caulobacter sp. UNC279MFTsu5.1 TaxID=1502775 RepID=UPI0008ECA370|nr:MFS transporter [Caulobacter sp. UNC279MFTsu5.1]SFJ24250.1 Cyanate permease [Caulobacter sp. UNC279MFTsu5.1]